ncbi:hypothetical protein LY76DRAFT_604841 [Colletotrichum caudatum]|nr:hypothetical protein LY76DRAFT_604841 [Colletotrichum caudatum]
MPSLVSLLLLPILLLTPGIHFGFAFQNHEQGARPNFSTQLMGFSGQGAHSDYDKTPRNACLLLQTLSVVLVLDIHESSETRTKKACFSRHLFGPHLHFIYLVARLLRLIYFDPAGDVVRDKIEDEVAS